MLTRLIFVCFLWVLNNQVRADNNQWFEEIKAGENKSELYRFLYYMPKGGDLHIHLSGSAFSEWWYELAILQQQRGYKYYTRTNNVTCNNEKTIKSVRPFIKFRNISKRNYKNLNTCQKQDYKALSKLNSLEKIDWLDSIRLDKASEGREEFFERHWQRLNVINRNPWIKAELIFKNMQAFAKEGLSYLEIQQSVGGYLKSDGSRYTKQEVVDIFKNRLTQPDALETGVTVRFQYDILRFLPNAEKALVSSYQFVNENNDLWVAINMVGREDNENGQPQRFASTMKAMKEKYPNVKASIHAGESEFADHNIRDTLNMGADRIGHGLNLVHDKQTMEKMQGGRNLIEINLISNLLLGYVKDYKSHPFPIYLRSGIPVTLSTDDRGMWDSTMTDEYFVAVTEFDLSWNEIIILLTNSIKYSFLEDELKKKLLIQLEDKLNVFENKISRNGVQSLSSMPNTRAFICNKYAICNK